MSDEISIRDRIFEYLRNNGVTSVCAAYDAKDGEGSIGSIISRFSNTTKALRTVAIQKYVFRLLNKHDPEWSEGDGSFGVFVLDVATSTINWEHTVRRMEYDTTVQVL